MVRQRNVPENLSKGRKLTLKLERKQKRGNRRTSRCYLLMFGPAGKEKDRLVGPWVEPNTSKDWRDLNLHVGFPCGSAVKNLPAVQEMPVWSLASNWVRKIPWRTAWQSTPVFLPKKILQTEEPGRLWSMGLQRAGHDWSDLAHTHEHVHGLQTIKRKQLKMSEREEVINTTRFYS